MSKKVKGSTVDQRAQGIRDEASTHATTRLARENLRLQEGAFATHSEWNERRDGQSARMVRINKKLK